MSRHLLPISRKTRSWIVDQSPLSFLHSNTTRFNRWLPGVGGTTRSLGSVAVLTETSPKFNRPSFFSDRTRISEAWTDIGRSRSVSIPDDLSNRRVPSHRTSGHHASEAAVFDSMVRRELWPQDRFRDVRIRRHFRPHPGPRLLCPVGLWLHKFPTITPEVTTNRPEDERLATA